MLRRTRTVKYIWERSITEENPCSKIHAGENPISNIYSGENPYNETYRRKPLQKYIQEISVLVK